MPNYFANPFTKMKKSRKKDVLNRSVLKGVFKNQK